MKRRVTYSNSSTFADRVSRISWGAIIAGGLTALAISVLLNLLGVGIGLSTIDPLQEANPLDGLGTGTIIWWFLSNIFALFGGGLVAGRMAGFPSKADGGLHGFLAWGLYATVSFYFLASFVGGVVSGIAGTASSLFGGDDQRKVVVDIQRTQKQSESQAQTSYDDVKQKIFNVINQAERLDILPEDASGETRDALEEGRSTAKEMYQDLNLDRKIDEFFNDLSFEIDDGNLQIEVEGNQDFFKKEELKQYLTDNTELSEQELDKMIDGWEQDIDAAVQKAEEIYRKVKQKAIKVSDKAADVLAKVSIYAFFVFLLGALAAYLGGVVGSPTYTVKEEEHVDHDNRER